MDAPIFKLPQQPPALSTRSTSTAIPQMPIFKAVPTMSASLAARPYTSLKDGPNVGPGKGFTAAQKKKMLEMNMKRNDGKVMSDNPGDRYKELVKPQKSKKGVTPPQNEWQFDHIIPRDKGGTNSFTNCQIISRWYNRQKSDK